MDANQLRTVLEYDPMVKFGGVYACDEIPITLLPGYFYIFNTAPSSHPGEHWISVYAGREVECFDSLARNKLLNNLKRSYADCVIRIQLPYRIHCLYLVGNIVYFMFI